MRTRFFGRLIRSLATAQGRAHRRVMFEIDGQLMDFRNRPRSRDQVAGEIGPRIHKIGLRLSDSAIDLYVLASRCVCRRTSVALTGTLTRTVGKVAGWRRRSIVMPIGSCRWPRAYSRRIGSEVPQL